MGTQHVACRDLGNTEPIFDEVGLGALTRPRSSQQNHAHGSTSKLIQVKEHTATAWAMGLVELANTPIDQVYGAGWRMISTGSNF
jgi:hypothetical protein